MSAKAQILPFDLRSLEIFLAVCETGTVAGAAREFGTTQPAVSLAVAEIERKTGISFFDREVRPLALTMAGGLLRQHATALIADARQVVPLLRETKHGKVPLIRTGSQITRKLTMVTRHRELGQIPRDLAHLARKVLLGSCVADLRIGE